MSHNERYKSSVVGLYFRVRHPGITQSRYKIPLVRINPRFVTSISIGIVRAYAIANRNLRETEKKPPQAVWARYAIAA